MAKKRKFDQVSSGSDEVKANFVVDVVAYILEFLPLDPHIFETRLVNRMWYEAFTSVLLPKKANRYLRIMAWQPKISNYVDTSQSEVDFEEDEDYDPDKEDEEDEDEQQEVDANYKTKLLSKKVLESDPATLNVTKVCEEIDNLTKELMARKAKVLDSVLSQITDHNTKFSLWMHYADKKNYHSLVTIRPKGVSDRLIEYDGLVSWNNRGETKHIRAVHMALEESEIPEREKILYEKELMRLNFGSCVCDW